MTTPPTTAAQQPTDSTRDESLASAAPEIDQELAQPSIADDHTAPTTTTTTIHNDPNVQQLKAIFPDQSDDVLEAVLAANGGDLERATDQLLQINDPDFTQDATTIAQSQARTTL
ncbi:hypothetical protein ACM66B_004878 [Microbotryomycetes sp. NB124-2]